MSTIDITIIGLYLLITFIIGIYKGRDVKDISDFAIGGRNFTTPVLIATIFATFVGGGSTLGLSSKAYSTGIIYLVIAFGGTFSLLVLRFALAPHMARFDGKISIGEMLAPIYGKPGQLLAGLLGATISIGAIAAQFSAMGYVLKSVLDISSMNAVIMGGAIVIIYSSFGGVRSVTFTDVFQFAILILAIPMVCNLALNKIGGYSALFNALPETHTYIFPEWKDASKFVAIFIYFYLPIIEPAMMQRLLMAKNSKQRIQSMNISAWISVPFYTMVITIGLSAFILFPSIDPQLIFPTLIHELLPIGIKGIVIAGLLAVIMSTADSSLNASCISFYNDFFAVITKHNKKDRGAFNYVRIISLLFGGIAIIAAVVSNNIISILVQFAGFWAPTMVIPTFCCVLGYKVSQKRFLTSVATGLTIYSIWLFYPPFEVDGLFPALIANALVFIPGIKKYK